MPTYSPNDIDAWARTIVAEAGSDPAGQLAVANVIANRLASGRFGASPYAVVTANNGKTYQFEPWSNGRAQAVDPRSAPYQTAMDAIDAVTSGRANDNTGGATHFYAPRAQAALGRQPPAWGAGQPNASIGGQLFYAPEGAVKRNVGAATADFLTDFPVAPEPQSGKGAAPANAPPTPAGAPASSASVPAGPDFMTDFPVAPEPAKGGTTATPPSWAGNLPGPLTAQQTADAEYAKGGDAAAAVGRGIIEGIPIAGPYLLEGANKLAAGVRSWQNDTRYSDELAKVRQFTDATGANHPTANKIGNFGGAVVGTAPLIATAPAAFGISGAGLVPNSLASAVSGAAISAADTAARNGLDPANIGRSAFWGGVFGGAAPVAAKLVGSGINMLANAATRTTPAARNIAGVLDDIGMSYGDAHNALNRMGPRATLADIDPALAAEAGSVAALGGAPTSILKNAMASRAASAGDRIGATVETNLGTRPDLTAVQEGIAAKASADAAPFYNASRAKPQTMDITPVIADIDARLPNASGGVASVLEKAKGYLTKGTVSVPGPNGKPVSMAIPKDDPEALMGARQALDDFIQKAPQSGDTTAGKNAVAAAQRVRGQIDQVLKTDANIAAGDAAYATQMRNLDAVNEGTALFKPGTRVEDVQRSIAGKTPEQLDAMRQGALASIHDALDNARQGEFAAARSLFGKSEANRAKLDALFPKAGKVFDDLAGEVAMRGTEQRVAMNSATAERQAIQRKYSPQPTNALDASAAVVGTAMGGGLGGLGALGVRTAWNGLRSGLTENALRRLSEGTARGLAASGPDATAFLDQIRRAAMTNRALNALANSGSMATNLLVRSGNALLPQERPSIPLVEQLYTKPVTGR